MNEKKVGKKIDLSSLSWHQIMELDACTRCGECIKWCPVYAQDPQDTITPREKIRAFRKIIASQNSLINKFISPESWLGRIICPQPPTEEDIQKAARALYECSTCRQCHFVCPSRIDTVELYEALRRVLVDSGVPHIETHLPMVASSKAYDNPWQQPRSTRARWAKAAYKDGRIKQLPEMIKPPKDLASAKPTEK